MIRFLTFYTILFLFSNCAREHTTTDRPNILLICVDDMGWSDLGCYGSEIKTPNLDRLAQNGMRFTSFYNTAKCFPSRAALITGVYAQDCGYDKTYMHPIRNAVTIGEVLQPAGYRTYWSGKHHGKENPFDRGFNRYYGLKDGAANHFNPGMQRKGEPMPAQKRNDRYWATDSIVKRPYTPQEKDFYSTDSYTERALEFLDENSKTEAPFFLYVAYTAPHDPLMAWPEDIAKYKGVYDVGYAKIRANRFEKQKKIGLLNDNYEISPREHRSWQELSPKDKEYEAKIMEVYAAMIDRIDQNVGRLVAKLDELEYLDNTLIVFVSDNGASAEMVELSTDDDTAPIGSMARWVSLGGDWANVSNTPFRFFKNYSHEGGINTPMIAVWPGKIKSGSTSSYPGHFIDFMPTFVDLAGTKYPKSFDGQTIVPMRGQSLLDAFKNPNTKRSGPLFWEWNQGKAIRDSQWKLVKWGGQSDWGLYNMEEDPTELKNLAAENPIIVDSLARKHSKWAASHK